MASSSSSMGRLARIEKDVHDLKGVAVRMTEILTDHSQQLTDLRRTVQAMDERMGGVNDRLDRLIALSMQERTASTERLGDIERRLARLEERSGI
ncbi:MAG TPA: hypothetical protein VJN18_15375 [Polyangiaceae bacterium]|nr:hypothetical protein [Polyangiaceae bacterium]